MYKVVDLAYNYNALEPYIDERTMYFHYEKHYKGYLNKLNSILNSINYDYKDPLEVLVTKIDEFPIELRGDILFNAGGVLNHDLYFSELSPKKNTMPVDEIKKAIDSNFGSFENFKKKFIESASHVVGSGWTFLVLTPAKKLEIINTSNQETPYIYGLIPIMGIDLWEHAYYLLYQNRRNEYIDNFFNIIDFNVVNEIYKKALKEKTA